jgi:carbon catabolite-derepressing protein kinase
MDYAPKGDLAQYISSVKAGRLTEPVARRFFLQLVSALRYCHKRGVSHRDIKPQNLLLSHDGTLKLSDFGLSSLPEQIRPDGRLNTACGTPAFAAPEVGAANLKPNKWHDNCNVVGTVLKLYD